MCIVPADCDHTTRGGGGSRAHRSRDCEQEGNQLELSYLPDDLVDLKSGISQYNYMFTSYLPLREYT